MTYKKKFEKKIFSEVWNAFDGKKFVNYAKSKREKIAKEVGFKTTSSLDDVAEQMINSNDYVIAKSNVIKALCEYSGKNDVWKKLEKYNVVGVEGLGVYNIINLEFDGSTYRDVDKDMELHIGKNYARLISKGMVYESNKDNVKTHNSYKHIFLHRNSEIVHITLHIGNNRERKQLDLIPAVIACHNSADKFLTTPILLIRENLVNFEEYRKLAVKIYFSSFRINPFIQLLDISELYRRLHNKKIAKVVGLEGQWWVYAWIEDEGKEKLARACIKIEPERKQAFVKFKSKRQDLDFGILELQDNNINIELYGGDDGENKMYITSNSTKFGNDFKNINIVPGVYLMNSGHHKYGGTLVCVRENNYNYEEMEEMVDFFEEEHDVVIELSKKDVLKHIDHVRIKTID